MTLLPKGALLLPIHSPNARGISYNQYPVFHVGTGGVLLHLSDQALRKAHKPIQIIVEVVGKEASQLQGLLKVAGIQAELIIANANGITCRGCHFINTTRVLLTTGQLVLSPEGQLKAHRVTQGTLKLERTAEESVDPSLNWHALDQVELLARAVQCNTPVYVKRLNVITGHYEIPQLASFERLPKQIKLFSKAATNTQPSPVGIAIAAEGEIYAQHLQLMSTEYEVGIKSAGSLHADHLRLDSQGRLDVSGDLQVQTAILKADSIFQAGQACASRIELHSQHHCFHSGTTQAERMIMTAPLLELKGQLEAGDSLQLRGHYLYNGGKLTAGRLLEAKTQQLSATGDWRVGFPDDPTRGLGHLTLESDDLLESTGLHQASGNIAIEGSRLELGGSTLHAGEQLSLKALEDSILLNEAKTQATHVIIKTPEILRHQDSTLTSHQLQITAYGLLNAAGKIYCNGPSVSPSFSVSCLSQRPGAVFILSKFLNNSNGLIQVAKDCLLEAPKLFFNNTGGGLMTGHSLIFQLKTLNNQAGWLQAGRDLRLRLRYLTCGGTLSAGQMLRLNLSTNYRHT